MNTPYFSIFDLFEYTILYRGSTSITRVQRLTLFKNKRKKQNFGKMTYNHDVYSTTGSGIVSASHNLFSAGDVLIDFRPRTIKGEGAPN